MIKLILFVNFLTLCTSSPISDAATLEVVRSSDKDATVLKAITELKDNEVIVLKPVFFFLKDSIDNIQKYFPNASDVESILNSENQLLSGGSNPISIQLNNDNPVKCELNHKTQSENKKTKTTEAQNNHQIENKENINDSMLNEQEIPLFNKLTEVNGTSNEEIEFTLIPLYSVLDEPATIADSNHQVENKPKPTRNNNKKWREEQNKRLLEKRKQFRRNQNRVKNLNRPLSNTRTRNQSQIRRRFLNEKSFRNRYEK